MAGLIWFCQMVPLLIKNCGCLSVIGAAVCLTRNIGINPKIYTFPFRAKHFNGLPPEIAADYCFEVEILGPKRPAQL